MSETLNPFLNAQRQVKKACDKLKLDPSVYELLKEPEKGINSINSGQNGRRDDEKHLPAIVHSTIQPWGLQKVE